MKRVGFLASVTVLFATVASATSFIVPTDEELIGKSHAIVIGTVEGSYVEDTGVLETVYEIRIERGMKGAARPGALLRVTSPGGFLPGTGGVYVPASPHFANGDRVLLFLTRDGERFRVTDLALGKFRFVTTLRGERLLVRDMEDVFAIDRGGVPHDEKVRRENGFLRFIEERAAGRRAAADADYVISAAEATLPAHSDGGLTAEAQATAFPGATYTSWVASQPVRWQNISAGVTFYKRTDQNISGAADGGVSVIQSGLAAWANDCGSNVNLIYGGQRATASTNHDGINVVEFNDPQGRISGSWGGSGTIGIAFLSFSGSHTYEGRTWWNITDSDVVFQDGFPATHGAFGTAMTHELGHSLGWRHSNQHYEGGGACDPAVEECTTAAIMNSSVSSAYGFTLQPWDVNAVRSVYPGGSCTTCTAPSITAQPQSTTISPGASTTLSVTASGTGPLSYQWYLGNSGNTGTPLNGATSSSLVTSPNSTTNYWVRVTNACGSANSATATVTVASTCTAPSITAQPQPAVIYPGSSTTLSVTASGSGPLSYQWYLGQSGNTSTPLNGATSSSLVTSPNSTTTYWVRVSNACGSVNSQTVTVTVRGSGVKGDFNGDSNPDILWRNVATSANFVWFMNGTSYSSGAQLFPSVSDVNWRIVGAGDFNADGHSDIVWRNYNTGVNLVWLMSGTTYLSSATLPATSDLNWRVQAVADMNDDGHNDIVWRNIRTSANVVWLMNGTSLSSTVELLPRVSDLNWVLEGSGDFNGDGDNDLVWRNYATGQNFVWFMNGLTYISGAALPSEADAAWQIEAVADYSRDGIADLVWRNNQTGDNRMWVMAANTTVSSTVVLPATTDTRWEIGGPR